MGFFDVLLGGSKLPPSKLDRLFAITTAVVTLESRMNLKPLGRAGVCMKPVESSYFEEVKAEIQDLLRLSSQDSGTEFSIQVDQLNYPWVVLKDPEIEDLVTGVHMVAQTMMDNGYGDRLLCAVFAFVGPSTVYWIYSFKGGNFYPFAPRDGQQRDSSLEFRLRATMQGEMPVEPSEEKWYPLWGMPI